MGKIEYCNRRISKYKKFEKALERLADESDIIHLIKLNRVSRLLHRMHSSPSQRKAPNYTHGFVIHDKDIDESLAAQKNDKQTEDKKAVIEMLL